MKINEKSLVADAKAAGVASFVAGAVIIDKRAALLLRRPETEFMGGIYELPSGKVEPGETLLGALRREVKEESNLDVTKVLKLLSYFDYESKRGKTRQFNFLVSVKKPFEVKLTEHDKFAWIKKEELATYKITDSVKEILSLLSKPALS